MKRFLFLFTIYVLTVPIWSQSLDENFIFVDESGNKIENGTTIVCSQIETMDGREFIDPGISLADMGAATNVYLKIKYTISRIDNGSFQICFPMTAHVHTTIGSFETSPGQPSMGMQDILSLWHPTADGMCVVTLSIETLTKSPGFPPKYEHLGDGPTITIKFAKGDINNIFCVNGVYYYKNGDHTLAVTSKDINYNSYNGSLIIPESVEIEGESYMVTSIGSNAFKDCVGLDNLSIPITITSIASNAFSNCTVSEICIYGYGDWQAGVLPINNIETLYLCNGITSIEGLNVNPSSIYSYSTTPPICDSNTFREYTSILHVPVSATASYFMAPYWYNFASIISDAIEPTAIILNTETSELEMGNQLRLMATVNPNNSTPNDVKWFSVNNEVATVENGIVTPVSIGECDIIAYCTDKIAICHVTVVPPRITITLDKHDAMVLPNHMVTLMASCSPVSAELAVASSDNTIALPRIVNGAIQVLGLKEGTAIITVNTTDGNGIPDECVVTVYTEPGDVNSDGYVNISDVTDLIDYLLSGDNSGVNLTNADCDRDENINISDVTTLIDFLLSGIWAR